MSESVKYLDRPFKMIISQVYRAGILQLAPGQSVTGYGSKISTDYMIRIDGEKIVRRVYAICYSNSASHYVIIKGETTFIRSGQLEEARDAAKLFAE